MALPFLPHARSTKCFFAFKLKPKLSHCRTSSNTVIKRQWIESTVFPPDNCSVFRTDGDARLTAVAIRLISDRKLKRVQRKQYRNLQGMLFDS